MTALILLAVVLIQSPQQQPIEAYRHGDYVMFDMPEGLDLKHIEITTDPPCQFTRWGNTFAGKTTATEGTFFGVVCENNRCTPYAFPFNVVTNHPEIVPGCPVEPNPYMPSVTSSLIAITCVVIFTFFAARKGWFD